MRMPDPAKYGRLLAETLPAVITDESEYVHAVSLMNKLAVIPEDRITPEQERLLDLIDSAHRDLLRGDYQIPDAVPHEVIQHLMQERGGAQQRSGAGVRQPWCDLGSHRRQAQAEQDTDQKAGGVFRSGA